MSYDEEMRVRRDREIEREAKWNRRIGSPFACKVVGVSFAPGYPDNLHALREAQDRAEQTGEPLVVILVRNPDNAYDSNAIQVHIPALGDEWGMIGHLTRPIVARLAPELDDDVAWEAHVESVLIDPDHMDRPGISIKCARAPEQEQP